MNLMDHMNNPVTGRFGDSKDFVCSNCYQPFALPPGTSWLSGEKLPCPYCKSRDTTPMLEVRVGGRKLFHYELSFKETP